MSVSAQILASTIIIAINEDCHVSRFRMYIIELIVTTSWGYNYPSRLNSSVILRNADLGLPRPCAFIISQDNQRLPCLAHVLFVCVPNPRSSVMTNSGLAEVPEPRSGRPHPAPCPCDGLSSPEFYFDSDLDYISLPTPLHDPVLP